jgi:hypothetical protein
MGFSAVVYNVNQVSFRQAITPLDMQGRMNATMRFIVWGTMPIGSVAGGILASFLPLRTTILIGALIASTAFLWVLASRRSGRCARSPTAASSRPRPPATPEFSTRVASGEPRVARPAGGTIARLRTSAASAPYPYEPLPTLRENGAAFEIRAWKQNVQETDNASQFTLDIPGRHRSRHRP